MRTVWPAWLRVVLAVAAVVVFFKLYGGWHWHVRTQTGPGVFALSPTGVCVSRASALELVTKATYDLPTTTAGMSRYWRFFWNLSYVVATVFPAALVAVTVYAVLTCRYAPQPPPDPHARCRRCGYVLWGLSKPRCPECGERV